MFLLVGDYFCWIVSWSCRLTWISSEEFVNSFFLDCYFWDWRIMFEFKISSKSIKKVQYVNDQSIFQWWLFWISHFAFSLLNLELEIDWLNFFYHWIQICFKLIDIERFKSHKRRILIFAVKLRVILAFEFNWGQLCTFSAQSLLKHFKFVNV